MQRLRPIVLVFAACASNPIIIPPTAPTAPSTPTEPATTASTPREPPPPTAAPGRRDFALSTVPMGLVLLHGTLVWADRAGAIWMMPSDGSAPPARISEQHRDGFVTHPFVAGNQVLAKSDKALVAVTVPGGKVTRTSVTGAAGVLEAAIGNATTIFLTVFKRDEVFQVPIGGGALQHVANVANAILALHRDTLYVASYATGDLFAIPLGGGAPRTIARKLHGPTALVVDDDAAFVYTESDRRVIRIELAGGATTVVGDQLENSDELVLAGDSVFTVSWPGKLVRLPKSGGAPATLADDLFQPRGVVADEHHVYVTSDSPPRIVRIPLR